MSTFTTEALPELATRRQVAEFLQTSIGSLARWAMEGRGPRFIRIGSSVRYRRSDVVAWLNDIAGGDGE